jgi:hypothetical protein
MVREWLEETIVIAAEFAARMNQMDAGVWDGDDYIPVIKGPHRRDLLDLVGYSDEGSRAMKRIAASLNMSPKDLFNLLDKASREYPGASSLGTWTDTGIELYREEYEFPDDDDWY